MHISSNVLDADAYRGAMAVILDVALQLPDLRFIDVGGGLEVPHQEGKTRSIFPPWAGATDLIQQFSEQFGRPIELRLEPGTSWLPRLVSWSPRDERQNESGH